RGGARVRGARDRLRGRGRARGDRGPRGGHDARPAARSRRAGRSDRATAGRPRRARAALRGRPADRRQQLRHRGVRARDRGGLSRRARGVTGPACLITGEVSPYRREPFRLLAAAEDVEVVAWRSRGEPVPGLTVRETNQVGAARLAASGRYRTVICGLGGRVALPGAYLGARRAGVPFVLWASLWAHPRTPVHALSLLPLSRIYRGADAVATYGPHVSRYVESRRGGRGGVVEAPQAVEAALARPVEADERREWRERTGAG